MEDDENEGPLPIVIDNGSCYIKAGYQGEEGPRLYFPTMIGFTKYVSKMVGSKEYFLGQDAEDKR